MRDTPPHFAHAPSTPPASGPGPNSVLNPVQSLLLPLPPDEPLNLEHTFRCGQIFRWHLYGDTWYGPYGQGSLAVRPAPGGVEVRARGARVTAAEAQRFLGLDTSLHDVYRRLEPDAWVRKAMEALRGLRILRQDPWECLASYICSQWNNIPKIELSTDRIARRWGTVHRWEDGVEVASFPPAEALMEASAEELGACALGYRCAYLVETARRVAEGGVDLVGLREASYDEALAALLKLPGIGRKVADCILLFSLDKPQACPVDVWVRRIVHELYPEELAGYLPDAAERSEKGLSGREHAAILRFAWDRWGMLAGYAQQYLFYARRLELIRKEMGK
jgi:N-glycosylase/DNA lyase